MQRQLILTAIPDRQLSTGVTRMLDNDCWVRSVAPGDYASLTDIIRKTEPTVVVMDLEVADVWLDLDRLVSPIPFALVILAANDGATVIEWLMRGADAFLNHPLSVEVVAAQVLTLARKRQPRLVPESQLYEYKGLRVDLSERTVYRAGQETKLSSTEFRLLRALLTNAGRTVPHDTLLSTVWGAEYEGDLPLLRAFILRLRKKLGDTGQAQTYIQTRGQLGYAVPKPEASETRTVAADHMAHLFMESQKLWEMSSRTRRDAVKMRLSLAEVRQKWRI